MQTLAEMIAAVNAYANYLEGDYITRDRCQFPIRNKDIVALRNAAGEGLAAAEAWREVERIDPQHLTLQTPDGILVAYTYEKNVERLALVE